MDINTDPDFGRAIDLDLVFSSSSDLNVNVTPDGSIGHLDWHGPHGTKALGHYNIAPVVAQTPDISIAFDDVRSYGHCCRPWLQ